VKALIAFGISLALGLPAAAGDGVQEVLDALRAEHGFPGVSVAWTGTDGAVEMRASGLADLEAGVPMTPESRTLAASIGKTFVAAAALSLQAEERLSLDDPVSKWLGDRAWLPRLPNNAGLTLRHLLTHTGGLPDHVDLPAFQELFMSLGPDDPAPDPEVLIALILDAEPLFRPGESWAYSDTGYLVAGLVIEAAAASPGRMLCATGSCCRSALTIPNHLTVGYLIVWPRDKPPSPDPSCAHWTPKDERSSIPGSRARGAAL
jgi:D-alanyl-D-alanine carboxypeptidase